MLTSTCRVCGNSKSDFVATECANCQTIRTETRQYMKAEFPNASESDILYAERQALNQRAHHAHRNYIDPRDHSRMRSPFTPVPPQGRANDTPPKGA
jgi:hypothetical protein